MKEKERKSDIIKATILALVLSMLIITTLIGLYYQERKNMEYSYKISAINKLTYVKDRLQNSLNLKINYTEFFQILISNYKTINVKEFNQFAEFIISEFHSIKSISLAPKGIIKYIYPFEENEKDLNLNLLYDEKKIPIIVDAVEKHTSLTKGPVKTLQGETLLINSQPIYIMENGIEQFWGLSLVTIDFDKLLLETGLNKENDKYYFALRINDASDLDSHFYWGNKEIFDKDSITQLIELPHEQWELAIYPKNGWNSNNNSLNIIVLIGIIGTAFIYIIIYRFILKSLIQKRQAQTDFLTGVMNKGEFYVYFDKYVTHGIRFDARCGLLVIDVDDFKHINDQFGHQIGDLALIQVSDKIKNVLRKQDVVARIGGDEFTVFIHSFSNEEELSVIANRILEEVSQPIHYGNITISVSVSIGGAICPDQGTKLDELFAVADSNMYASKRSGKNQYLWE